MNNYMFGDKKNKIKDTERSLISETVSIEGTINSSGAIDVAGLVKGPVISKEVVVRETGSITGSIEGDRIEIHGHMDGKISGDDVIVGSTGTVKGDIEFGNNLKIFYSRVFFNYFRFFWFKKHILYFAFYIFFDNFNKNGNSYLRT